MTDKEIFSTEISKGKRTYFFDIKKSEQGDLYLKISESKKTESGFEHHRLVRKIKSILADSFQSDLNRIKDVLEEKGVKQSRLAEQLGKRKHGQWLCAKKTTAKT